MLMASAPKKKSSRADRAREIALYRYALIRPLADPALSASERGKLVRQLASQVHLGPFGEPVTVSRATLDRWIRAWRSAGFDALIPAEAQVQPRTDPGVLELAARLKAGASARTAAHIARIIAAEQGWAPSARTLQRHFARLELGTRPDGNPPKAFGRFEAAECDELWVSDGLHGPIIDGRRAVLFALLDDHSRYVVGHRWGHGEDTLGMQAALHDAVKTHGCPQRLYCDNGSAYSSTPAGLVGGGAGHQAGALRARKTPGQRQDRTLEPHRARPVPGRGRPQAGGGCCGSLAELNRSVHRVAAPALPPRRALRNRGHPGRSATTPRAAPGRPNRIRRSCAGRFCGVSSARSPRSPRSPCTATATRSTRPWSAAPSICCSPRST